MSALPEGEQIGTGYRLCIGGGSEGALTIDIERPAHAGGPDCNAPFNRPDGLLILAEGTTGQFLVESCGKRPFIRQEDLASHNLGQYATTSSEEVAALGTGPTIRAREGTVFRYPPSTGTKYIIDEIAPGSYQKRPIDGAAWTPLFVTGCLASYPINEVSDAVFINGYATGPTLYSSSLRPDGQLVYSGQPGGTQYLLEGGYRRPFSSAGAVISYGLTQPLCSANLPQYPLGATLQAREGTLFKSDTSGTQFVIERQPTSYWKKAITSLDSLLFYQLQLKTLYTWPASEVAGYPDANHVHPYKSLISRTWVKNLVYEDLTANAQYFPPVAPGSWDPAIGGAEGAWNAAPIWPDFLNWTTRPADVHIDVGPVPGDARAGWVDFQPTSGTVTRAIVKLNTFVQPSADQPLVAHELGHVLLLEHDGLNPDGPDPDTLPDMDQECGPPRVPQTIMDYDCYVSFGYTGPVNWDFCGANHKFQSGGDFSGC
jgi:hypothetical protein